MPGPFIILALIDCWEATLNRHRPHSCHFPSRARTRSDATLTLGVTRDF